MRELLWWGLTRSRSVSVLRSQGDVISEGSACIMLRPFFSHAPFFPSSLLFFCVFGFTFGSSHKARTSSPSSSFLGFRFSFFPSYASCACQLGLVRPPRLMEEFFISSSRELSSPGRRIRMKFHFTTVETGYRIFFTHLRIKRIK